MRPSRAVPQAIVLACLAALLVLGCAKSGPPISAQSREDAGASIDTDVMAYLSLARSLHHQANLSEDERDLPGAIAPLEHLVHAPKPHEGTKVPEVEEVLADTYARMAELRLHMGDLEKADREAHEGLTHAPDRTYFRGHLLEVMGVIEETRASSLADAGHADAAEQARNRARDDLKQAVSVQEEVLAGTTEADASPGRVTPEGGHK
jgi:hypothetical protein